jgi:hypothetical protein
MIKVVTMTLFSVHFQDITMAAKVAIPATMLRDAIAKVIFHSSTWARSYATRDEGKLASQKTVSYCLAFITANFVVVEVVESEVIDLH